MQTGAENIAARLDAIAACSTTSEGVTRLPYTAEHRAALGHIKAWMEAAGLTVRMDAAASLIGRRDGDGPALLIGSHQDSVRHGGRYDGIMGVAVGCAAVEALRAEGRLPSFPIEVIAFADEEGVRFPSAMVGSRALAGTVDPTVLTLCDEDKVPMGEALRDFGGNPDAIPGLARAAEDIRAYFEVHIEQGPVLEERGLALGVVTGICGIERHAVTFSGQTGHAGTVPMSARQDALVAASEFIHRIHDLTAQYEGLRATVGTVTLSPNAVNAIPNQCNLTLEIRDIEAGQRAGFRHAAKTLGAEIAARRRTEFAMTGTYAQDARSCAEDLMTRLDKTLIDLQGQSLKLPSGATHDASPMADLTDIAMLFVRCAGGHSHRPDEAVSEADLNRAVEATKQFILSLAD